MLLSGKNEKEIINGMRNLKNGTGIEGVTRYDAIGRVVSKTNPNKYKFCRRISLLKVPGNFGWREVTVSQV